MSDADKATPRKVSPVALAIGRACFHYVTTRFPPGHESPPHPMLDLPWFADAAQKELDRAGLAALVAALKSARELCVSVMGELHHNGPHDNLRMWADGVFSEAETALKLADAQ